jgi:hypothetical protein
MMGAVSALEKLASTLELTRAGRRLFFQYEVTEDMIGREQELCTKGTLSINFILLHFKLPTIFLHM